MYAKVNCSHVEGKALGEEVFSIPVRSRTVAFLLRDDRIFAMQWLWCSDYLFPTIGGRQRLLLEG